jgi:type I restriction enzyme R subunit
MNLKTENNIKTFAIELLEKQGYEHVYAPDIVPDSGTSERARFEDVPVLEHLLKAAGRITEKNTASVDVLKVKYVQK